MGVYPAVIFLFAAIVSLVGIIGAVYLGTETKADSDQAWRQFLDEHPDAIDLLEADHEQQVLLAQQDHRTPPPPVPR